MFRWHKLLENQILLDAVAQSENINWWKKCGMISELNSGLTKQISYIDENFLCHLLLGALRNRVDELDWGLIFLEYQHFRLSSILQMASYSLVPQKKNNGPMESIHWEEKRKIIWEGGPVEGEETLEKKYEREANGENWPIYFTTSLVWKDFLSSEHLSNA